MFIKPSQVSLGEIISTVVDGLRFTWQTKNIHLETSLPNDFPFIMADGERIWQVVWNLIINSIKFTPPSGKISVIAKRFGDSEVVIEVSDTGVGITPDYLPRIFDRFSQQDSSASRSHGGLGLGLALVKHIVELHGGTVSAFSAGAEKGATFIVRLPIVMDETSAAHAEGGSL